MSRLRRESQATLLVTFNVNQTFIVDQPSIIVIDLNSASHERNRKTYVTVVDDVSAKRCIIHIRLCYYTLTIFHGLDIIY